MPSHKSDLNFSIKFDADTKKAQKELQALREQLDSLGKLSNPNVTNKLDAEIKDASKAAAELKTMLDRAINTDTGKLDLSKFSRSLEKSGTTLRDYRQQLMAMGSEGEKAFTQMTDQILKAETPLKRSSKLIDDMWTSLKNTARWEVSSSILKGLEGALQQAYSYAQDLNKSLTDIRIVTGYGADRMADFAAQASKAAKSLSATTTEYTNASLIYFQQGLNDQQVKERTDVTIKMANVSRESAETVSNQMTAIWNNFDDGSKSLEYYADVMTALGAATASSTKEISDGLEKFAAIGESVGLSYEYATAALATITSNTRQSADVVGTALKTLFARIQGLSLGETLEDGTDLNKYSEALAKVGISIKDSSGGLKDMDNILDEMAAKWDTLNNDQQVALAQTVAGVRQYTQLIALMDNWNGTDSDNMMANLKTAKNAEGALQAQADVYAESWEGAKDRVTAALESIFNKLLKDEFFIDMLNNLEEIITHIDNFIERIGGLEGVLTALGAIATKVFSKQISQGIQDFSYNLNFKKAQEEDKAMRRNAAHQQAAMLMDSHPAQADAYKKIADLQIQMINNADKMSDAEKELVNYGIERYKNLALQAEEIEKQSDALKIQAAKAREAIETDVKTKREGEGSKAFKQRQKATNKAVNNVDAAIKEKNVIEINLKNKENELRLEEKKLAALKKGTKEYEDQKSTVDKIGDEIKDLNKQHDEQVKKLEKGTNELAEQVGQAKALEYVSAANKSDFAEKEKANLPDQMDAAGEEIEGYIKGAKGDIKDWSDHLTSVVSGITDVAFGMVQIKEAWQTLSDPDASAWEKLNVIVLQMLPAVVSTAAGFKEMGSSILELITSTVAKTSATAADTTATIINKEMTGAAAKTNMKKAIGDKTASGATRLHAGAQALLNGQLAAGLLALWPYILAIGILAAAIIGLVVAYNKWKESTPEEQLKKAKEETEHLTEATNEAIEACNTLKNTIASYEDAKGALEMLTEGTEEYKEKVKEANEASRDLIEQLGLVYGKDYTIDSSTGEIIINDSVDLEAAQHEAEERIEANRAATNASKNREKELENEVAVGDYAKELQNDIAVASKVAYMDSGLGAAQARGKVNSSAFGYTTPYQEVTSKQNLEDYLGKAVEAVGESFSGDLSTFFSAEQDDLAKAIFKASKFDELTKAQQAFITEITTNTTEFEELYTSIQANNEAIKANTKLLLSQSFENEEFYKDSEYKNAIVGRGAEAYDEEYTRQKATYDEKSKEQLQAEYAELMGYTFHKLDKDGNSIFKDEKGNETTALSEEEIRKILAGDAATNYAEQKAKEEAIRLEDLAKVNPLMADFIENANGGNKMSYYDQFKFAAQKEDHMIFNSAEEYQAAKEQGTTGIIDAYENLKTDEEFEAYNNFNPYGDVDEVASQQYLNTSFSEDEKQTQLQEIHEWWANLSEEDKTLALQIDFTEGNWEEQLDEIKANALINNASQKYELDDKVIRAQAEAYRELYAEMELTQEQAVKMSIATQRAEKGVATLSSNWEEWSATIKAGNADLDGSTKATTDYIKTVVELTKAIEDLTGQDDLTLSQEFFDEATGNIQLLEEAAKGSEKAIAKLGVAVQKDIVKNLKFDDKAYKAMGKKKGFSDALLDQYRYSEELLEEEFNKIKDTIMSGMDLISEAIDAGKLQAGESIDSIFEGSGQTKAEWVQAMNEMAEATGMSVADMNEMLSGLHMDAEVSEKQVTVTHQKPIVETTTEIIGDNHIAQGVRQITTRTHTKTVGYEPVEEEMMVAQLGVNGEAPGDVEITSLGTQQISPSAVSTGGGGGGGGSTQEPLEYEDEIERYHENTRALERLERALNKVTTAKDRAFGKERLRLIDQEIAATEKLVAQQRALLHETREYLKQDFAEIQQYGFTYDEFGELTNYDEVMKAQIDKVNAVIAGGDQEAIDAAMKEYEEFKENMQQYEETLTQYEEAQAQLQEYINQVVDLKLEKITTEVEIKILVNDKELTRLEYLLRKIEYEGKGAADAIALMGRQFEQISEKAKPIQEAIDKIYEQARAEGRGLLEEEVKEIKSFYQDGVISSEEEKRIKEIYDKAASEDRMLTQAEEEQIQEYKEQLLELNQEVMDIVDTIKGKFMETLEELNGKVDESIGRFATYTGMFQTLSDVITLSGKAGSKYGMDMLNTLSARTVANASTAMRSSIRGYEALDQIYQEAQANLERAIKDGDEYWINHYQDTLHQVEMMREASYESMLSSWSEALQAANDLFDTKLTNMVNALKQNIGDIDKLVEIYDRAVELEDLYISGNKSIYELSKLARDVGKDIDKTANIIAKNKLAGLLEQINKLRAEGVKLSQYDLEYWQAKYELEVAEIALQEAQEAKAQVKLTRNTAGGWGYTYVADAEAISEAQQNYEESLYNMQELHDGYIRDYSQRLIKNRQDLVNALQDLDKTSLTFEEDALRLKEHHFKQEEYLIDELNKAYQRAGVSYQDTLLAQTYGGTSLEDSHTNFINSVVKMIQDELLPGYQEFQESVDGINSQAGTTVEDAMDKIFESSITMEDEVIKNINDLTSGVKEVSDEIWNFQETYGEAISKMLADNEEYYSKTIKMYQNFMAETEADKWLQYFDDMRGPGEVLGVAGSGATGAMAGNGSTAVTNGAFGDMMNTLSSTGSSRRKGTVNVFGGGSSSRGEGVHLRDDGTYGGIASIQAGEEQIPEAAMRALRDDPALEGMNLNSYAGDDGSLSASELKKLFNDKGVDYTDYIHDNDDVQRFGITLATGGYTGSWGSEGRLAILHEKELVLNKYDTENMLDMVNTLRDIDWRAKLSELFGNIQERLIVPISGGGDNLQQDVHIEASFPGVSNHFEIEEAFNNLINTASQWANRKKY